MIGHAGLGAIENPKRGGALIAIIHYPQFKADGVTHRFS